MICVVTHHTRRQFQPLLDAMHRDRKRIFVDRLRWKVPVVDGQFEIDQFDTPAAVYLIASDPSRQKHLASVRLLPSTGPHLLGDLFPFLCEDGVPTGEHIWEITRLCTSPDAGRADSPRLRGLLAAGLFEFALLHGISQLTGVAHVEWLSQVLAAGWECAPLGPLHIVDGESIGAIQIRVHAQTLQNFRAALGIQGSILEREAIAEAA